jgi:hypothetical protein
MFQMNTVENSAHRSNITQKVYDIILSKNEIIIELSLWIIIFPFWLDGAMKSFKCTQIIIFNITKSSFCFAKTF